MLRALVIQVARIQRAPGVRAWGCATSSITDRSVMEEPRKLLLARWLSSSEASSQQQGSSTPASGRQDKDAQEARTPVSQYSTSQHITDSKSNAPLASAQYKSSADDPAGVQKNWFTSLYKQLNYIAKTGAVENIKGRQKAVFEQVEREFETLYSKYILNKVLDVQTHRATLLTCLSIATYRILNDELGDTKLVRDIIRTNLGSVMLALLRPVHRFKLWILRWIMREDMYKQAVNFLPAIRADMGTLCTSRVEVEGADKQQGLAGSTASTDAATVMTVDKCMYHEILAKEDAPFLLSEFCCHHALLWLHEFRQHGVVISMDRCMAWDDNCCQLRIARPGQAGLGLGNQQPDNK